MQDTSPPTGRPVRKPRKSKSGKPIIVDRLHLDDIDAVINIVQAHARERLITASDILDITGQLFTLLGITKKALNGCSFKVDLNAHVLEQRGSAGKLSTQFSLKYEKNRWYLTDVSRGPLYNTKVKIFSDLTEEAKAALIDKYLRIRGDFLNGMLKK